MNAQGTVTSLLLGLLMAAPVSCGSADRSAPEPDDAPDSAQSTTPADDTGPLEVGPTGGTGPQICARFTACEITALAGSEVGEGQVAGPLDSACAWDFTTRGIVLVQAITADFWGSFEQPDDHDHEELEGLGNEAFVQPSLVSGWTAAVLYDDRLILVDVSGPTATPDLAVRILEGVVPQLAP